VSRVSPMEALDYVPHPLVIVTAGDPDKPGRRGGMTAAWVSRVSWDPPLVAVAIAPERFTLELIRERGEFVINVVGPSLREAAFGVFGSVSGRQVDKFERSGVRMVKAKSVTAPALADSVVSIECKLEKVVEAGDHAIVVGRVVDAYKMRDEKPLVFHLWEARELK